MKTNNPYLVNLFLIFSFICLACSSDPVQNQEPEEEVSNLVYEGETTSDRLTDNEDRFYENKIPNTEVIATLKGDCSSEDTISLNQQITNLSNAGGGVIRIKKGNYCFLNVILKSNIHIKIDSDVTIQPDLSGNTAGKNLNMFRVGEDFLVENVAITNSDEDNTDINTWFKGNIPIGDYNGVRFVEFSNVKNFKFSGMNLTDNFSVFSNIVLNLPSSANVDEIPIGGIVSNVKMTSLHVGYGVVQMQTGKKVLYKNLDGEGGVTLRVETGAAATNQVNKITVDDVVGRNIKVSFGDAAFNMSPHRVDQGRVDIEGVTAVNSTHAVQIAAGFIGSKPNLINSKGTFDSRSFIGDITVTGGDGAQIKGKDFKYFDCEDRKTLIFKCQNPDNESTFGKSIGAIRDNASSKSGCTGSGNGCYDVIIGKITKTNTDFEQEEFFIYPGNAINGCGQITAPANCI